MSFLSPKIITSLVLTSFLMIVFFSFATMMHGPDGRILGDCPLSVLGASLCPQDIVSVARHHISAYYTFLNVPVGAGLAPLIAFLLFVISAVLLTFVRLPLLGPPALSYVLYDSQSADSYSKKITRWLSLLENSPSNFY